MPAELKIAADLSLPGDAVTQTFAFLARRGAGKTYAGSVLAEELIAAGFPVVILDPVGVWWGLRSHYPVVILGGSHGDIPLEPAAGRALAGWLIREHRPTIFDLSRFGEGEMVRFVADLADEFYRKTDGTPTHWILDEADEFAPQGGASTGGSMPACLGAVQRLTRRGRARGIGVTVITQRSAVLNKSVLTQTECLIAMQMTAPQDIAAVEEWWKYQGDKESRKAVVDDLPFLPTGKAFVYSPGWLRMLKAVTFRKRHSFDSSSTPKPGEKPKSPSSLESLDLDALSKAIGSAAEQAKANDPKELKREIADLKRQLAARPKETVPVEVVRTVEVPVLKNGQLDRTEKVLARVDDWGGRLLTEAAELRKLIAPAAAPRPVQNGTHVPLKHPVKDMKPKPKPRPAITATADGISPRQQRFLDAAATLTTLGADVSRDTVCAWVGVHPRGGSVGEELKALESAGMLTNDRGRLAVTDAGMNAAGPLDPTEAIERAKAGLTNRQQRFFDLIVAAYPNGTTREAIAETVGIHPRGGSLGEDLGRLVGRGLVEKDRGTYRAREFLFAGA